MSSETSRTQSGLEHIDVEDTVRVRTESDELVIGEVDATRVNGDGDVVSHAVTVEEQGYDGDIWDLEAQYDPREGRSDLVAVRRVYQDEETLFVEEGVESVEPISTGIDTDRLDPGATVEAVNGCRYRVVVSPWEREYDNKALVFNLDSASNVCEKLDSSEVVERVE